MVCGNVDHAVLIHLVGIIMSLFSLFFEFSGEDWLVWDFFLSVGGIISSVLFVGWYNCGCCSVSPVFMLRHSCLGKKCLLCFWRCVGLCIVSSSYIW